MAIRFRMPDGEERPFAFPLDHARRLAKMIAEKAEGPDPFAA